MLGRKFRGIIYKPDWAPVLESFCQQKSGPRLQFRNILAPSTPASCPCESPHGSEHTAQRAALLSRTAQAQISSAPLPRCPSDSTAHCSHTTCSLPVGHPPPSQGSRAQVWPEPGNSSGAATESGRCIPVACSDSQPGFLNRINAPSFGLRTFSVEHSTPTFSNG